VGETKAKSAASLRLVSYNVLSDSLDSPTHYLHCDPKDLDHETRFRRVEAQLVEQMEAGAVLCLQEVSRNWGGRLTPLFEKHGYMYASALTGSKFGGYMGQCIAWPVNKFRSVETEAIRVSDTVDGWPERPRRKPVEPATLHSTLTPYFRDLLGITKPARPPFEPWKEAEKRHNAVVMARLQDKESGEIFCVGTYHMPCLFGSDLKCQVMSIHLALLFQHAQRFAGKDPLIIAGDFNVKVFDPLYAYMSTGKMPPGHPQNPTSTSPLPKFSLDFRKMKSAYLECNGSEPEFTNLAKSAFNDTRFIETLDYIWLSDDFSVKGVRELPSKQSVIDAGIQSYPNSENPSDHVMVWADLAL